MAKDKPAAVEKKPSKPASKSQITAELAEATGLTRKQVAGVFEAMLTLVQKELGKKGPGVINLPGLLKLKRIVKPATKAGKRANPFKPGEMMDVKAKPARNIVKAQPLKSLKELIAK